MRSGVICLVALLASLASGPFVMANSKDLVKFGGDLAVEEGMRVRDAVAILGDVTVDGTVERQVVAVAGSVFLGPSGEVGGDVISIGGTIEEEEGAAVAGNLIETPLPSLPSAITSFFRGNWPEFLYALRGISIVSSIGFIILALLIVSLTPRPVSAVSAAVEGHTVKVFGWGLLALLLVVPVGVLLAISIVGLVLIPLEMILVVAAILVGYVAVAHLVGKKITIAIGRPNQPMFWETLVGLIVLWVVGWIPVLGWLIKSLAGLLGLGGVIFALAALRARWDEAR